MAQSYLAEKADRTLINFWSKDPAKDPKASGLTIIGPSIMENGQIVPAHWLKKVGNNYVLDNVKKQAEIDSRAQKKIDQESKEGRELSLRAKLKAKVITDPDMLDLLKILGVKDA